MTRRADWPQALDTFLRRNSARRFEYGTWDCFQFVSGAVRSMTGMNLGARFEPYASKRALFRGMWKYCKSRYIGVFASQLLAEYFVPEIEPSVAQRGDVVLTSAGAFGLVALNGRSLLMVTERDGLVEMPRTLAIKAWRI